MRSSCMRALPELKNVSRSMPYERYGSRGSRSSCTARASSRDASPFSGDTMRSTTNAR